MPDVPYSLIRSWIQEATVGPDDPGGLARYHLCSELVRLLARDLLASDRWNASQFGGVYKLTVWKSAISEEFKFRFLREDYRGSEEARAQAFVLAKRHSNKDRWGSIGCWATPPIAIAMMTKTDATVDAFRELTAQLLDAPDRDHAESTVSEFVAKRPKGVKSGILSPWLYCLQPRWFPVLNGPAREGMQILHLHPPRLDLQHYLEEADRLREFADKLGIPEDLARLDRVLYRAQTAEGLYARTDESDALIAEYGVGFTKLQEDGLTYQESGQLDRAYDCFLKALEEDPRDVIALTGLAKISLGREEIDRAEEFARRSVQVEDDCDAWLVLAYVSRFREDWEQVKSSATRSLATTKTVSLRQACMNRV